MGFVMIGAALSAIAAIFILLFQYQRAEGLEQIRIQGVSLTRLLSSMPVERLVPAQKQKGLLDIVRTSQTNVHFAYISVTDTRGKELAGSAAPGILAPPVWVAQEPASWNAQRVVPDTRTGRSFLEFYAPVIADGERIAQVRVGYSEPSFTMMVQKLSFMAMLALPVFLLAPLFYFLIRREINPLRNVSEQIRTMLGEQSLQTVELKANGEMGEFVDNFNRMVRTAEQRIHGLEVEADGVLTSAKVLSYQKARIESTLQSLPDAVLIFDDEGLVTFANRKLTVLLGVEMDSIIGMQPQAWCQQPKLCALLTEYAGPGVRSVQSSNLELESDNAPGASIKVNAYPLFSPRDEQSIFGTMVVLHDATTELQAREVRKEFIGRLAHELKTPLHIIGMYSESLRDPESSSDEVNIEAGNIIFDEVERMSLLIKNLLSITEIEMGSVVVNRTRTRLNDLLEDVLETVSRGSAREQINCRVAVDADLNAAYLDKDLFRIVLSNLLTNAFKYNRPGGEVVLSASETANTVVISVRDSGIGIEEGELERIFDRFFRSENEAVRRCDGHGLGLSLVKQIVELHGGQLRVTSTLGEGSEFTIVLAKAINLMKEAV